MATITPFKGIVYNQAKAGSISSLICPPYDIISPAEQQALYRKNPHNVVRLEYGLESPGDTPEDNRYTRAAALLDEWFKADILRQSETPAIYVTKWSIHAGTRQKKLRGLICLVRIEIMTQASSNPMDDALRSRPTGWEPAARMQGKLQPDIFAFLRSRESIGRSRKVTRQAGH
jgi:uncharacterized protein (DUF1015 family)